MDEHRGVEVQKFLVAAGMVTEALMKNELVVRIAVLDDDEEAGFPDLLRITGGKRQGWLVAVLGSNLLWK